MSLVLTLCHHLKPVVVSKSLTPLSLWFATCEMGMTVVPISADSHGDQL